MIEFQFERDKRRFRKNNLRLAEQAEQEMRRQRRELGLPELPKPFKIGKITQIEFHNKGKN